MPQFIPWPWALFLVLLSPAIGSFLGVVVDRLAAGRSLWARSSCGDCGRNLAWREMIPLASALLQRGRCRGCSAAIPSHLIRIEAAALCAAILALFTAGTLAQMWLVAAFLWCLVALFYSDMLHLRLPDPLTAALFVLGLALAWSDPARSVAEPVLSAFGAAAAFWALRWAYFQIRAKEGLGLGDVKLALGLGAAFGWALMPVVTLVAALLGLTVAALEVFRGGTGHILDRPAPFGSYLVGAAVLVLIYS